MWFEVDANDLAVGADGKPLAYRFPFSGDSGSIIGGSDATKGEFPWFVSLELYGRIGCGGTLIAARKVLTAAHCVLDCFGCGVVAPTQVRIGHIGTADGETRGVSCVAVHPDYTLNGVGTFHDVAVITLNSDAVTSSFVTLNQNSSYPSTSGQALTAIGFGRTTPQSGSSSTSLKKATENFVSEENCQTHHRCASSSFHVCAADGTNVGVCYGDSGGPLLDSSNVQVGLTSYGDPDCGNPPDVFTNVAAEYSWIQGQISSDTCTTSHTQGAAPCGDSACSSLGRAAKNTMSSLFRFFGG